MIQSAPSPAGAFARRKATPKHSASEAPLTGQAAARTSTLPETAPLSWHVAADERLLVWFRFGAVTVLWLTLMSDTGPGHSMAVRVLVGAYACYALLLVFASARHIDALLRHVYAIHGIDIVWTTAASTIGGGVGSHAFAYFAFVLAAAALRWGLAATVANGSLVLVIGLVQNSWAASGVGPLAFEVDMLLLPVSYITCGITVLFGTLAERLHRARREAMAIATLSSSVSRMPRLRDAVAHTLEAVTRLMGAARVTLVVEETYTGSRSAWHADRRSGQPLTWEPFQTSGAAADWLPPARDPGACEFRRTSHALPPLLAISLTPQTVTACPELSIPAGVLAAHWTRLIALPFENRDAWAGHLYVMDPTASPGGESRLRFLADLVQQITPGLLNLYLLRWLRSRAGSLERGRISRELHDTVHQSLAGIEMRLDVLRRENAVTSPYLAADLAQIQTLVKDESLQLRHLMERLRPDDVDADGLRGTLAELVNRFSRESGVQARLDWMVARVDLPPRRCSHVVRIVQEALINVRRHSGASCTLIRVEADAAGWRLLIEDNGCGLGFTGRVTARELELQPRGPRVIRERAAALGGSVAMESSPTGTRLEITFPGQEIH